MQRREQQKRAAALGGGAGGSSYLGGGVSGYAPVSRYEAPDAPATRTASPAPAATSRPPHFKTGGMKLGSKKTRQAELLDALGGEVLTVEDMSAPPTPIPIEPPTQTQKDTRGSLPSVTPERQVHCHNPSHSFRQTLIWWCSYISAAYTSSSRKPYRSRSCAKAASNLWSSKAT